MKNKMFCVIRRVAAILLCLSSIVSVLQINISASSDFSVNAKAAVVYDVDNGSLLYAKNENARLSMASTTKIMTALVAIERENLNKKIEVDPRAVDVEGSSAYLRAGEEFTLRELLYALMLRSANDAAEAIAYAVAGSIEEFAFLMNEKATLLGLCDTHFTNPHGLDNDEHYTTALELAKITAAALEYPEFCEIVSTKTKRVEKEGFTRLFANHNKMLSRYDGCIGVKTGYTQKSGRCLVSAAERNGIRLIAVTLSCPVDWREHEKMLDFGFSQLERVTVVSKNEFMRSAIVKDGVTSSVKLGIDSDITIIKKNTDDLPKIDIDIPQILNAPVELGDAVGKIRLTYPDGHIEEFDVIALENVKKAKKKGLFGLFG
jgi:D-alanyl-D-alanine carboxypeptidase